MHRNAWISVVIFVVLLALVLITREDQVSVGVRSLALPTLDAERVEKIAVGGSHKSLLSKEGESWRVADPDAAGTTFAVESNLIDGLKTQLGLFEVGAFVTSRPAKHEELEITDDKGLSVRLEQSGGPALELVFGRGAKGGGNYVRLAGNDEVFVGKSSLANTLKKDVKSWRKRKIVDKDVATMTSVEVKVAGEAPYVIEQAKDLAEGGGPASWRLAGSVVPPEGFRPDADLMRRLATSLANLRAVDFHDEGASAATGLADATKVSRAAISLEDGSGLALLFGGSDDKKRVYAQVEGDPQVYLVTSGVVKNVLRSLEQLRDLSLVSVEPSKVTRALLVGAEGTVELTREEGAWTVVQPSELPAGFEFDAAGVDAKLTALGRIKGGERLLEVPADSGLDKPSASITLFLDDGSEKRIAFGAKKPPSEDNKAELFYVRGAEEEAVYTIGKFQKQRYDKPLDLFKKVAPPPMPPGGAGGMQGLESLPPDVRKKLMESLRQGGGPGGPGGPPGR
jgi:hypothetical protein